jgi:hypothetical protein
VGLELSRKVELSKDCFFVPGLDSSQYQDKEVKNGKYDEFRIDYLG